MNFIDLFAGAGGFRQGFENQGHTCVGFCEIDPFAVKGYRAMYDTENEFYWSDITEVSNQTFQELNGSVDIICAGMPCQAFSICGLRKGFEDTRGTLFFDVARAIKYIQPRYVLIENVKNLVTHDNRRTFTVMLETLKELNYNVEYEVVNSKFHGVAQNRQRIFILATRSDLPQNPVLEPIRTNFTEVTTIFRDIMETTVDASHYLNQDKVDMLLKSLPAEDKNHFSVGHHPFSKRIEFRAERYTKMISGCLLATDYKAPKTVLLPDNTIRKLVPIECFKLQAFSLDSFKRAEDVLSKTQLYKLAGNSVTVSVIERIASALTR